MTSVTGLRFPLTGLQYVGLLQASAGALLAARPDTVLRLVDPTAAGVPAWLVWLLGLRMLAQGSGEVAYPGPLVGLGGATVDSAHALSMVGVAAVSRRFRRPALVSAVVAIATAAAQVATANVGRAEMTAATRLRH